MAKYGSYLSALSATGGRDVYKYSGFFKAMQMYHSGGVVGSRAQTHTGRMDDDEVMAILKKGELVLNEDQKKNLYELIDARQMLANAITDGAVFENMYRNAYEHIRAGEAGVGVGGSVFSFSPTINVEINHSGRMEQQDAERYGKAIADTALENLYDAMRQRGIGGIGSGRLRPA